MKNEALFLMIFTYNASSKNQVIPVSGKLTVSRAESNEKLHTQMHGQLMTRATYASVIAGSLLAIIKLFAYFFTGSVALLTSLIDSFIDVIASLINMFAVKQSLIPADREHSFGHGKVESLAGLAQAAFICGSVLFIIFEAVKKFLAPTRIDHGMAGIIVMLISIFVTVILVSYQRYVIKKTKSVAISADSLHYSSDLFFNISVIAAIVLSYYFDMVLADPVIALVIAFFIVYNAWQIAKTCLDQLMDRELPDQDRDEIMEIAMSHPGVKDVHGFRSRKSGRDIFIQLHLEMDHEITLEAAHRIALDVQNRICDAYPSADVIIHQDPDTEQNQLEDGQKKAGVNRLV